MEIYATKTSQDGNKNSVSGYTLIYDFPFIGSQPNISCCELITYSIDIQGDPDTC